METKYTSQIIDNVRYLTDKLDYKQEILLRDLVDDDNANNITYFSQDEYDWLQSLNLFFYSLRNEISNNVLLVEGEFNLQKYLHYLCKIYETIDSSLTKYYVISSAIRKNIDSRVGISVGLKPCNDKKKY